MADTHAEKLHQFEDELRQAKDEQAELDVIVKAIADGLETRERGDKAARAAARVLWDNWWEGKRYGDRHPDHGPATYLRAILPAIDLQDAIDLFPDMSGEQITKLTGKSRATVSRARAKRSFHDEKVVKRAADGKKHKPTSGRTKKPKRTYDEQRNATGDWREPLGKINLLTIDVLGPIKQEQRVHGHAFCEQSDMDLITAIIQRLTAARDTLEVRSENVVQFKKGA